MNRAQLQDAYINQVIDDMDHKDMWALLFDSMDSDLDKYSDQQLIEEVSQYYPELIEGANWCSPFATLLLINNNGGLNHFLH